VPSELTFMSVAKIDIDPRVLVFSLAVTLMTGLLFGLLPALRATRPNLASVLAGTGAKTTADRSHNRLRHALIVVEVGLSLVLLIGAGLMIRSFLGLSNQKLGFEPKNLIAATIQPAEHRYPNAEAQRAFAAQVVEVMSSAPGVESMTVASGVPPSSGGLQFDLDVEIEGHDPIPKDKSLILPFSRVDTNYFRTLQIPITRGRAFLADDASDPEPLMIVNETMSRHFWPNADPVGARIRFDKDAKWMRVVGVAGDIHAGLVANDLGSMAVYYPAVQDKSRGQLTVILRTTTDAAPLIAAMKARLQSIDKDQPIYRIDTVEDRLSDALSEPRFYLQLLTVFAALTLLLVAMGLYGVMAHAVAQRTREIGIRQAVGADRRDILTLVLKRGLGLTGAGIVVGILAALSMSKVMATFLFGAPATDPQTYALVGLLMTAVAAAACWVPALRATKVDPIAALRQE
ncbi:MAG: FtsX-like permease family protein, partial [Vicinamibacteria bacterium]